MQHLQQLTQSLSKLRHSIVWSGCCTETPCTANCRHPGCSNAKSAGQVPDAHQQQDLDLASDKLLSDFLERDHSNRRSAPDNFLCHSMSRPVCNTYSLCSFWVSGLLGGGCSGGQGMVGGFAQASSIMRKSFTLRDLIDPSLLEVRLNCSILEASINSSMHAAWNR